MAEISECSSSAEFWESDQPSQFKLGESLVDRRIRRALDLHAPRRNPRFDLDWCFECNQSFPCQTVQVLRGDEL